MKRLSAVFRRGLSIAAVASVAAVCAAGDAPAQQGADAAAPDRQREHVVRDGDTLWDLAEMYLDDPFLWPRIHEVNTEVVENPHLIYPDERLRIPGMAADAEPSPAEPTDPRPQLEATPVRHTRFYTPPPEPVEEDPTVVAEGETAGSEAVPEAEFRTAPWLADPATLPVVARMIRQSAPGRVETVALPGVHRFEEISLARTGGEAPEPADELLLIQLGREIEPWGRVVEPVAVVTVAAVEDDVILGEVTELFGSVEPGDLALPVEPFTAVSGVEPQRVEGGPTGRIVAFRDERQLHKTSDQAFIDLGSGQGVEIGDELVAWLPERRVEMDGEHSLPAEPIAVLRVIRVTTRTSTARVIDLRHPVLEPGLPVRVVRKVP